MENNRNKLKQKPAFPITEEQMDRAEKYPHMAEMNGMSKRFYAACAVMQGIMANNHPELLRLNKSQCASLAYQHADELLKQEAE